MNGSAAAAACKSRWPDIANLRRSEASTDHHMIKAGKHRWERAMPGQLRPRLSGPACGVGSGRPLFSAAEVGRNLGDLLPYSYRSTVVLGGPSGHQIRIILGGCWDRPGGLLA
eukprot:755527-Hanusia_phi.AAC.1